MPQKPQYFLIALINFFIKKAKNGTNDNEIQIIAVSYNLALFLFKYKLRIFWI